MVLSSQLNLPRTLTPFLLNSFSYCDPCTIIIEPLYSSIFSSIQILIPSVFYPHPHYLIFETSSLNPHFSIFIPTILKYIMISFALNLYPSSLFLKLSSSSPHPRIFILRYNSSNQKNTILICEPSSSFFFPRPSFCYPHPPTLILKPSSVNSLATIYFFVINSLYPYYWTNIMLLSTFYSYPP